MVIVADIDLKVCMHFKNKNQKSQSCREIKNPKTAQRETYQTVLEKCFQTVSRKENQKLLVSGEDTLK